jgi:hypothetical protein
MMARRTLKVAVYLSVEIEIEAMGEADAILRVA